MTEESKQWYLELVKTLGFPSVLLVIVIVGLWRAGSYISTDVIKPLLQTHLEFVKESTSTLKQMQDNGREALIRIEAKTDEILKEVK